MEYFLCARRYSLLGIGVVMLAERTGLEPATPGVTGRYSNQLNYRSTWKRFVKNLLPLTDANNTDISRLSQ